MSAAFGLNLSFAAKRWPEPEVWADKVRELDVTLVQFSFDLLDPWWPAELAYPLAKRVRQAAEANDLEIHSAFVGLAAYTYNALLHPDREGREAALKWFKNAVDLAAEMGVKAIGGPVGGLSVAHAQRPEHARKGYQHLLESLVELTDYAKAQGLTGWLIEPTPLEREVPWTVQGAETLLSDLGETAVPVTYTVDVGHALYRPLYGDGAGLEPWFRGLGEHIGLIHLQQTDGQSDSHWGFTKEGVVRPGEVARFAKEAGLNVPLVLEVFYPFELDDKEVWADLKESVRVCQERLGSLRIP